jgi:class 3 adenylate cyclase
LPVSCTQWTSRRQWLPSHDRDIIELLLRVGLNSGQIIAGEIGSGPFGYTAVGDQAGMAQRMAGYRELRDHYHALATSLGFEGCIQWAESMPD